MIQCLYKYRPTSFGALVFLVRADEKDRVTQVYTADMLRLLVATRYEAPPRLLDVLTGRPKEKMTAEKANAVVDDMIRRFAKGGKQ